MIQAKDIMQSIGLTYRQVQYWDDKIIKSFRTLSKNGNTKFRDFTLDDIFLYKFIYTAKQSGWSLQKIQKDYIEDVRNFISSPEFGPSSSIYKVQDGLWLITNNAQIIPTINAPAPKEMLNYDEIVNLLK